MSLVRDTILISEMRHLFIFDKINVNKLGNEKLNFEFNEIE